MDQLRLDQDDGMCLVGRSKLMGGVNACAAVCSSYHMMTCSVTTKPRDRYYSGQTDFCRKQVAAPGRLL